ncbi:MAG: hypothetical protein FWH10_04230 [Oscillospiraceae bacterium]|nr:hypothetical protein [Oscillospiraceae bacterium]
MFINKIKRFYEAAVSKISRAGLNGFAAFVPALLSKSGDPVDVSSLGSWITGGVNAVVDFLLEPVRFVIYSLMALPLIIASVLNGAIDIFSGIEPVRQGLTLTETVNRLQTIPADYDDFLCFDIERMKAYLEDERKLSNENNYYGVHKIMWADKDHFKPFFGMGDREYKRMEDLWRSVPDPLKNYDKIYRMPNKIEYIVNGVYGDDPKLPLLTYSNSGGQFFTSVDTYQYEGKTYYAVRGDDESRLGKFETRREAAEDYMLRTFFGQKIDKEPIYPAKLFCPYEHYDIKPTSVYHRYLGYPVAYVSYNTAARMYDKVRYYDWESLDNNKITRELGNIDLNKPNLDILSGKYYDRYFEVGNKMNSWMTSKGYDQFKWSQDYFASYKYWVVHQADGIRTIHFFSIQVFFSVKPLWRASIDNNPTIVADLSRPKSDWGRYTPETQEWMKSNNITPGSERMYERLVPLLKSEGSPAQSMKQTQLTLMDIIMGQGVIRYTLLGTTLISLVLCIGCSIFAVLRSMGDLTLKRPLGKVMRSVGTSMMTFLLVPVLAFAAVNISGFVMRQVNTVLDQAISGGYGGTKADSQAAILSSALTIDSLRKVAAPKETDLINYRRQLISGQINWRNPIDFMSHFDPLRMFALPAMIGAWFSAFMMVAILLLFMRRVFDVVLLYIAAPFVVAPMPLDDGNKFKAWRELFVSKIFMGFASLITLKIVLMLLPVLWNDNLRISNNDLTDCLFKLLIMLGGMYAAYKSNTLLANVLSAHGAEAERETASFANSSVSKAMNKAMAPARSVGKMAKRFAQGVGDQTIGAAKDKALKKTHDLGAGLLRKAGLPAYTHKTKEQAADIRRFKEIIRQNEYIMKEAKYKKDSEEFARSIKLNPEAAAKLDAELKKKGKKGLDIKYGKFEKLREERKIEKDIQETRLNNEIKKKQEQLLKKIKEQKERNELEISRKEEELNREISAREKQKAAKKNKKQFEAETLEIKNKRLDEIKALKQKRSDEIVMLEKSVESNMAQIDKIQKLRQKTLTDNFEKENAYIQRKEEQLHKEKVRRELEIEEKQMQLELDINARENPNILGKSMKEWEAETLEIKNKREEEIRLLEEKRASVISEMSRINYVDPKIKDVSMEYLMQISELKKQLDADIQRREQHKFTKEQKKEWEAETLEIKNRREEEIREIEEKRTVEISKMEQEKQTKLDKLKKRQQEALEKIRKKKEEEKNIVNNTDDSNINPDI